MEKVESVFEFLAGKKCNVKSLKRVGQFKDLSPKPRTLIVQVANEACRTLLLQASRELKNYRELSGPVFLSKELTIEELKTENKSMRTRKVSIDQWVPREKLRIRNLKLEMQNDQGIWEEVYDNVADSAEAPSAWLPNRNHETQVHLLWNVISMLDLNRRTALSNALALQQFHIISLCETWLVDTIPNSGLFIGNRSIFRRDRQPKRTGKSSHGGVLITADSSIPCKEITEFNVFEDVVGIVCHFCSVHLLVLSVYCPHENSPHRWASSKFTHLLQEIDTVQQKNYITEIIVTGDISFPLTDWNSFSSTSDYEDSIAGMFVNSGFEQTLRKTTSGSLDICLLNNPEKVVRWFSNTFLIKSAFLKGHFRSDHDPLSISFDMQTPSVKTTQTHAFSYSRVDFNKVNKYIIENPFYPYCYSNCDKLLETWYEWLHEIMIATIPIRTNHRSSLAIWVTSPTSSIIRKLKSLQRKLNSEPSPALRNKVRSLEDLVASKINEDLMLYEESIFKSRQFSTIQRYQRYIRRPDPIPTEICHENSTANTDEEKSVLFNTFFCSVFSKSNDHEDECTAESTEIPAILEDQLIEPNFSNNYTTNLLQNLKPQKACGPDNLPNIMLNKCSESLAN